jgi:hypothetical protein
MFNPLKMAEMLQQANKMQEEMQRKLSETVVEGTSGGGAVTVTMNGKKELIKMKIFRRCKLERSQPRRRTAGDAHRWSGERRRTQGRCGNSIQRARRARRSESQHSRPRLNLCDTFRIYRRKASVSPPSTGKICPVVHRVFGLARNRIASAQSTGSIG